MFKDFKIIMFIVILFLAPVITPILITFTNTGNDILAATPTPMLTPTFRPTPTPLADTFYVYQVVTGEATDITETTATLSASAIRRKLHPNAYPLMTLNITMALVYWEESNPEAKITAGTVNTSGDISYPLTVNITGLKPATTYMFQAIVQQGTKFYPDGEVKSFQTLGDPVPTPTPIPGDLRIQFYNQDTSPTSNQLYLNFRLVNTGTSAVNLANVKLRYYYTKEGTQAQNFWCDWSSVGSGNITHSFVTMSTPKTGADTYVEIGFLSGAGNLAAGGNVPVQTRVAKVDWSNYNQSDDYSFRASGSCYDDWIKVTGYLAGALYWGIEP